MKTKLTAVALVLAATVMVACEEKKADTGANAMDKAKEATKDAANTTGGAVKEGADKATEAAKDAGEAAADKAKEATDSAKEKVAELTDAARSSMNDYLSNLGKLTETLAGAKDPISGGKAAMDAKPLTEKVSGALAALDKLSPELKASLRETFKDQLSGVTAKYKEQVDRLAKDSTFGKALSDMLKNVKLFE